MGYKRASWHSGLTYQQTCPECNTTIKYTDHKLGFRYWFPDGFVYCTNCKKPLRHDETFAIDANVVNVQQEQPKQVPQAQPIPSTPAPQAEPISPTPVPAKIQPGLSKFCSQCGNKFDADDIFCSNCGAKRK